LNIVVSAALVAEVCHSTKIQTADKSLPQESRRIMAAFRVVRAMHAAFGSRDVPSHMPGESRVDYEPPGVLVARTDLIRAGQTFGASAIRERFRFCDVTSVAKGPEDRNIATPAQGPRNFMNELRQYLGDKLLARVERRLGLRKHLEKLAYKLADTLADAGQAEREAHLQTADESLKSYLSRNASTPVSPTDAPGPADQKLIGELIQWWMKHAPFEASRRIVDAVGLGGAYRLPEGERLRLARAFLAMLDIDSPFEGDQAAQGLMPPRRGPSPNLDQAGRAPANGGAAVVPADATSERRSAAPL
jgi:hypothetical protein